MNTVVALEPQNASIVIDLCQRRMSPQASARFIALAQAFLNPNSAASNGLIVTGSERFSRKLQLLYFLMRVAEKNASTSNGQPLVNLVKKPEEVVNGRLLGQINSRIEGLLSQERSYDYRPVQERQSGDYNSRSADFRATQERPNEFTPSQPSSTQVQQAQTNPNVWDLFENVRRRDYGGVEEDVLVRDLIFVLQGLEGSYLRFSPESGKYYISDRLTGIARPISALVERLGAIGSDFRFLQNSIAVHREQAGVLKQSFCRAMAAELAEYLKLVAFLESTLSSGANEERVSLKKVVFWFHEAGLLLAVLKEVVQAAQSLKGGALLSFLESQRLHGNERVRVVLSRLLEQMLVPFSEMLSGWLQDGTVNDGFGEFFIARASSSASADWESDAASLWNRLFALRAAELPAFIPEALGKRALVAGKTRLFIQAYLQNLPDHLRYTGSALTLEDVDMLSSSTGSSSSSSTGFLQAMEKDMTKAYGVTCKQVKSILIDDCRLIDQLRVIRQYMLLAKGDFSLGLMDLLAEALERPASTLFRHNLVGILEAAIKSCSRPSNTPDWILNCLDVRLLGNTMSGWDAFALDYRTAFPLNCILDGECMTEYAKLSRYLWSLKRSEFILNRAWQQLRRGEVKKLKKWELLHYEMTSFVRASVAWSFEVMEEEASSFESTLQAMLTEQAGLDLDAVIGAHRSYLLALKTKLRLWSSNSVRTKTAALEATIKRFCDEIANQPRGDPLLQASTFLSIARHWQMELDDLLLAIEREAGGAGSPATLAILQRLDYTEYHRRRNGFDSKKYNS